MTHAASRPRVLAPALVHGFGAAVAMWTFGFIARFPGIEAPPIAVAVVMGLTQVAAGWAVGQSVRGSAVRVGLLAGLITGLVNLLILGSLLSNPEERNSLRQEWLLALGAWLLAFPALAAAGAAMGRRGAQPPAAEPDWLSRFAVVAAASVLPLLTIGGLVTSKQAGLAVPDWPNSFGYNMFLLPLRHMEGGVYFEHGHRLFGTLVGLTTLVLTGFTLATDHRRGAKALAVVALVAVIAQGILGALRVTGTFTLSQTGTTPLLSLAFVHGITGQIYFAFMCVLACILSPRWTRPGGPVPALPAVRPGAPRTISAALVGLLLVQLCLGAAARHFDKSAGYLHIVSTHAVNAFIVLTLAIATAVRAARALEDEPALAKTGKAIMHTAGLQILLGGAALGAVLMYRHRDTPHSLDVLFTTAHQATGALLLALAAMTAAWARRLVAPAGA